MSWRETRFRARSTKVSDPDALSFVRSIFYWVHTSQQVERQPKWVGIHTDFPARALHLAKFPEAETTTQRASFEDFKCDERLRCRRNSAGDASSSVMRQTSR